MNKSSNKPSDSWESELGSYKSIYYQVCRCDEPKLLFGSCHFSRADIFCQRCIYNECNTVEPVEMKCPIALIDHILFDLVLIPSQGKFYEKFNNSTGFHMAIVIKDQLYEFDRHGLRMSCKEDDQKWKLCLPLDILYKCNLTSDDNLDVETIIDYADVAINRMLADNRHGRWREESYHDDINNCFDFVFQFMRTLIETKLIAEKPDQKQVKQAEELWQPMVDKIAFSEAIIVPETKLLARYLLLYNKLADGVTSAPVDAILGS